MAIDPPSPQNFLDWASDFDQIASDLGTGGVLAPQASRLKNYAVGARNYASLGQLIPSTPVPPEDVNARIVNVRKSQELIGARIDFDTTKQVSTYGRTNEPPWTSLAQPVDKRTFDLTILPFDVDIPVKVTFADGKVAQVVIHTNPKAEPAPVPPTPSGDFPLIVAKPAGVFSDSIGVCTHITYTDRPYGNRAIVGQRIKDLGIKHLRDGWGVGSQYAADFVKTLGVKMTMVIDPRQGASADAIVAAHAAQMPGCVEVVESRNEPDAIGVDASVTKAWTAQVVAARDAHMSAVKVAAPSMADTNNPAYYQALGLLPGVDLGNTHDYPGDQMVMNDGIIDVVFANQKRIVGDRPVIATETGYSDATVGSDWPISTQAEIADRLPILYAAHHRRGILRTFAYEFMDEGADSGFQNSFGLIRADGTPKPSFLAIRRLIALYGYSLPTPAPLPVKITGGNNTKTMLHQRDDGHWLLAVWEQGVNPPSQGINLLFDRTRTVTRWRPSQGPTSALSTGTTYSSSSSGTLTVLEIA